MSPKATGRIQSLHLHPDKTAQPMRAVESFEVIAEKGIVGNGRYFSRISRSSGQPSKRQLSLMEREQIDEHAVTLGLQSIPAGAVRVNIETTGIDLMALIGREVEIGDLWSSFTRRVRRAKRWTEFATGCARSWRIASKACWPKSSAAESFALET